MYVEQRLTTCEVCCERLALQYEWAGNRPPHYSRDRVVGRCFPCPACNHPNGFVTLMYAYAFQIKVIPGPSPDIRVHPNSLRRLLQCAPRPRAKVSSYRGLNGEALLKSLMVADVARRRLESTWPFVVWWIQQLLSR